MIVQFFITILSLSSMWLISKNPPDRRGFFIGLLSQPFWLYETFSKEQWGMALCAIVYTFIWGKGVYNYWFKEGP